MGIGKTFYMDCDKCGQELTDRDGMVTAGREVWLNEKAYDCGWRYIDGVGVPGWYCGKCVTEKQK